MSGFYKIKYNERFYDADVHEHVVSRKEATYKGLKAGGLTLFMALCSIIIPLAHFLTVPLGILAAPVIGFIIYKVNVGDLNLEGSYTCPHCAKNSEFKNLSKSETMSLVCNDCKTQLKLVTA